MLREMSRNALQIVGACMSPNAFCNFWFQRISKNITYFHIHISALCVWLPQCSKFAWRFEAGSSFVVLFGLLFWLVI